MVAETSFRSQVRTNYPLPRNVFVSPFLYPPCSLLSFSLLWLLLLPYSSSVTDQHRCRCRHRVPGSTYFINIAVIVYQLECIYLPLLRISHRIDLQTLRTT